MQEPVVRLADVMSVLGLLIERVYPMPDPIDVDRSDAYSELLSIQDDVE